MKRYDLINCSIVVPIHVDCLQRLDHLNFLVQYFSTFFKNYKLIIAEQGKTKKVNISNQENIHVEFVESSEEFSTSEICNMGAFLVETPFFCKCDTDAVIHPDAFFNAFELLKQSPLTTLVMPYNGVSFTLTSPLKEEVMSSFEFNSLPFVKPENSLDFDTPHIQLKSNRSTGLIHHFKTSTFKKLGGYNEEFIGWGYEDNEIITRFKKLGYSIGTLEHYNAYHLDHPRIEGSKFQLLQNMHRLQLVENMTADQLVKYIKTWTRFTSK